MFMSRTLTASPIAGRPRLESLLAGVAAASPLLLGVVPFGLVYGVAAVAAGFTPLYASMMSLVVFAGASQMAAIQLMAENTPMFLVLLAGLVINMRMLLYSASISPHFRGRSLLHKGILAYFLTDQAYAVGMARFGQGYPEERKGWYYLGGGGIVWSGFAVGTVCGATLGASLPKSLELGFAVPLTFLALLAPHLRSRYGLIVAVTAGAGALLFRALPYNCGVLAAVLAGIVAGCCIEWCDARNKARTAKERS